MLMCTSFSDLYQLICINSFRYTHVITSTKIRLKTNVATDEDNSRNEI